jgi:hypothetical protein
MLINEFGSMLLIKSGGVTFPACQHVMTSP